MTASTEPDIAYWPFDDFFLTIAEQAQIANDAMCAASVVDGALVLEGPGSGAFLVMNSIEAWRVETEIESADGDIWLILSWNSPTENVGVIFSPQTSNILYLINGQTYLYNEGIGAFDPSVTTGYTLAATLDRDTIFLTIAVEGEQVAMTSLAWDIGDISFESRCGVGASFGPTQGSVRFGGMNVYGEATDDGGGDPEPEGGYCAISDVYEQASSEALDLIGNAKITEAITAAEVWVDKFTGSWFRPRTGPIHLRSDSVGRIHLPVTPTTGLAAMVVSVAFRETPDVPLPANAWQWLPAVMGEDSVIVLGSNGVAFDMLRVGAEPWNGGYAHLYQRVREFTVTGTFGEPMVPPGVRTATAMLAAWMLGVPLNDGDIGNVPGADSLANVKSLSTVGYSVTFGVVAAPVSGVNVTTTGLPAADRLLAPWKRVRRSWGLH